MPSLLANVPEGIVWGRVTAYVTSFVADGGTALPDGTPDAIPLNGTVTFTPTVGVMAFPTLTPPQQAAIQSLQCPIIGGVLYAPGTTPENVGDRDPGVILVASEQPLGLPDRVQYKVTWALEGAQVAPVTIDVPSQATVDLATVIPATPGPGKVVVVSTVDRERAEDAASAAEAAADTAETAATVAVTAKTLAEGFAGDAETARDQAVTAAAALQDTGWRALTGFILEGLVTSQTVAIRRVGNLVTIEGSFLLSGVLTGAVVPLTKALPYGFRPRTRYASIGSLVGSAFNVPVHIRETNSITAVNGGASSLPLGVTLYFAFSWMTNDPWPTTLPGTPA